MHPWVTKCWRVTRFSTVQNANNARGPTCGGRTAWRFQKPWPDIGFKHESKVQQVVYTSKRTSCQFGVGLTLWLRQYIRMCTHCRNLDAPKFDLFLKIGDYWKQIRVNLPELRVQPPAMEFLPAMLPQGWFGRIVKLCKSKFSVSTNAAWTEECQRLQEFRKKTNSREIHTFSWGFHEKIEKCKGWKRMQRMQGTRVSLFSADSTGAPPKAKIALFTERFWFCSAKHQFSVSKKRIHANQIQNVKRWLTTVTNW